MTDRFFHCWRCRDRVAMLSDWEYFALKPAIDDLGKTFVCRGDLASAPAKLLSPFRSHDDAVHYVRTLYEKFTGERLVADRIHALGHHWRGRWGAPCTRCGRYLRTPTARFCAECGEWAPTCLSPQ